MWPWSAAWRHTRQASTAQAWCPSEEGCQLPPELEAASDLEAASGWCVGTMSGQSCGRTWAVELQLLMAWFFFFTCFEARSQGTSVDGSQPVPSAQGAQGHGNSAQQPQARQMTALMQPAALDRMRVALLTLLCLNGHAATVGLHDG